MTTFLSTLLRFLVILAVLGVPLWFAARREGRPQTIKNYAIGGGAIAVVCGLLAIISERQMEQCADAGYSNCFDYGTTGFQTVLVVGFAVSAWLSAYFIWRG